MSSADRMKDLLLAQFADKRNICALLDAIGNEIDILDEVREDIHTMIYPSTASGKQLDLCGEVADMSRQIEEGLLIDYFGFPEHGNKSFDQAPFRRLVDRIRASGVLRDTDYRMALMGKIAKNNTDCSRESTIASLKRIFDSNVRLENAGNAKVRIGVGRILSANELNLLIALDLIIRAAGVGVDELYMYDKKPFGFTRKDPVTENQKNYGNFYTFGEGVFARGIRNGY